MFKRIKVNKTNFLITLLCITLVNVLYVKSSPDFIFLQFVFVVFLYQKERTKDFFKDWSSLIIAFIVFEYIRGLVDNISPFYNATLYKIYFLEKTLFGELPTIALQNYIPYNQIFLDILFVFHSSFFYYSFSVAFIIWLKKDALFSPYKWRYIGLSLFSLISFFLFPTAPPWFVAENLGLGLERLLMKTTVLVQFAEMTFINYVVESNLVAAFPSLHTAWPAFTSLFLIKHYRNKIAWLSLIIPLMISFTLVYTGEHYIIDVFAGWILAFCFVYLPDPIGKYFVKAK